MNLIDLAIIVALVASLLLGYQRGLLLSAAQVLGSFGGLLLGIFVSPWAVDRIDTHQAAQRQFVAIAVIVASMMLGGTFGVFIGLALRDQLARLRPLLQADRLLGALFACVTALAAWWLFAVTLNRGPSVELAALIQNSAILHRLDSIAPNPPAAFTRLEQVLAGRLDPETFIGLEPTLPGGLSAGAENRSAPGVLAAAESVVLVSGPGCGGRVSGSGFAAAEDFVVTNAHVVAGLRSVTVTVPEGKRKQATVVAFDPDKDVAVLHVSGLGLTPLTQADGKRGTQGAVLGYPGGGAESSVSAVVTGVIDARGRDIFGRSAVDREVLVLAADVRPGNSGGPVVDLAGHVLGLVYARSLSQDSTGFALSNGDYIETLQAAIAGDSAIDPRLSQCAA